VTGSTSRNPKIKIQNSKVQKHITRTHFDDHEQEGLRHQCEAKKANNLLLSH
jgi:hypothetical protein